MEMQNIMEIHNISEDFVVNSVKTVFDAIKQEKNPDNLCLCDQCRLDTICYALNRTEPSYIISNRGITRIEQDWAKKQQAEADIVALVYKGLKTVNHNMRKTAHHDDSEHSDAFKEQPAYDLPLIVGRLFDGESFSPIYDVAVELRSKGELVPMRSRNWQNPYTIIKNTPGSFTFWPVAIPAEKTGINKIFEFSIKVENPAYETFNHFFKLPSVSSMQAVKSHSMEKTYKLPDLYIFRPGEAEKNG